jgi:hypothetical protein
MSSISGKLEILGGLRVIDLNTESEEEASSANELRIWGFKFVQEHVEDCRIDLCFSNHDVIHHRKPKFDVELIIKICYGIETESKKRKPPVDRQAKIRRSIVTKQSDSR